MSDWNTHIHCANIVNKELKFSGKDLDLFLYGNLLPDVNMGWIIAPEVRLEQADTHFDGMGQEYFWAPLRFYDKYKDEINKRNPIYLGYMFHLWMDVCFMSDFVSRISMSEMIDKRYEVREIKWKDAAVYIKDYRHELSSDNIDEIVEAARGIDEVQLVKSDLLKVADYVNAGASEYDGGDYRVYTTDEFDKFYEKTCQDFIKWVLAR